MSIKSIILLCLMSISFVSCNTTPEEEPHQAQEAATTVSNSILFVNNTSGQVDVIQFVNEFGDNELHEFNGTDTLHIATSQPLTLSFLSPDLKITYYPTYPGDTIYIEDDSIGSFQLRAEDPRRTNELLYSKHHLQYSIVGHILKKAEIDQGYNEQITVLKEFIRNHDVSPQFEKYITSFLETSKLHKEIKLAAKNKDYSAIARFAALLSENQFPESAALTIAVYSLFNLIHDSVEASRNGSIAKQYELIQNLGISKELEDRMLFTTMKHYKPKQNLSELEDVVQRFAPSQRHASLKEYLQKNLELSKLAHAGAKDDQLIQVDGSLSTLHDMLDKYRGKVIYIDFWASWCAPCIAQFPYSKKLEQAMQGKDVVLLSISLDKDRYKWEKKSGDLKLSTDHNYLLISNFESGLAKSLGIKEIPRYILLNKNGQIVNKNAHRPQDPQVIEEIERLLM